ncbi:BIR7B protein, partial [Jacana jacana]|nr:BIR7B protein [Jacana jacana]
MGDVTAAEETERRASYSQLFESSMRNEARRLRTFQQWPGTSSVSARDLVRAGFFFVGPRDEAQWFCCGGILKDWGPGDWPALGHMKLFPSCKFICGEDVGSQGILLLWEIFNTVDGQFLCLLQGTDREEAALPNEPEYPEMVMEEMRLSVFQNWPQCVGLNPEQVTRAGFFYTGEDDVVKCFYCAGRVRNWSSRDDPWWEHAKWYPGCAFLLQSKGREYIRSVQDLGFFLFLYFFLPGEDESRIRAEEELQRLQEERLCKLCMDGDVSVVFIPCGHLVACRECAINLSCCPICRALIQGSVRTFM